MKAKTIFIILLTALVTIILMKNAESVDFWIFGIYSVPKLAILGTMFLIGVIVGLMIGRGKKKKTEIIEENNPHTPLELNNPLSESDSNYIN